jgi:hypothetical protein
MFSAQVDVCDSKFRLIQPSYVSPNSKLQEF